MPNRLTQSHDRLIRALEQPLAVARRVGDASVRECASLVMLDAIGFAEELGMIRGDEADRHRAAVRATSSSR